MNTKHTTRSVNLLLVLAILVLVNLVGSNSYVKLDLTRTDAYSLSRASVETLALAEDPVHVKVFYTAEVPTPYSGVRQYLLDLLVEYRARGGRRFSYEVVDTASEPGRAEARSYGLRQVEIQEVREDEFQSRSVYMGAVVLYGNVAERVDQLARTTGLEYRLTTAMRSAITQADALSGTTGRVVMTVFASPDLRALRIDGFAELESTMRSIHERINADNYERIDFEFREPSSPQDIAAIASGFGVQALSWQTPDGVRHEGLLDIVLMHDDRVEQVPLQILSGLLGGYFLPDPSEIEEAVRQSLRSLVAPSPRIAYATGNGEKALDDYQQGAGPFAQLLRTRYEIVEVNPAEEPLPTGIDTLVMNGPTGRYTDEALYRIDQFVLGGGSILVFHDRHLQEQPSQQQAMAGAPAQWRTNETGLERLFETWGAELTSQLVLDEESYVAQQAGQRIQLYQAPIVGGSGINRESVVTARLEDVILLNATEVLPATGETSEGGDPREADYVPLLSSSPRSWTVASPQLVTPYTQGAPASAETAPRDLAVLLEGTFRSSFDRPVSLPLPRREDPAGEEPAAESLGPQSAAAAVGPSVERFRGESVRPGKALVVTTSALTTAQMLDPQGASTPNSVFLLNAVDYLNGAPGFAELRSKGLGVPRLAPTTPQARTALRWVNTIAVPLLVAAIGLAVWAARRAHARRIRSALANRTVGQEEVEA